jgi:hypothetical protein
VLIVKVELWPRGDRHRAREIGRAAIINVEHIPDTANEYVYLGVMNDVHFSERFTFLTHDRSDSFWALVGQVALQAGPFHSAAPPLRSRMASLLEDMYADQPDPPHP